MFLAEVPYKSNGESVSFHDDHVEFKGQSIRYDEIETMAAAGQSVTHTYIGIPVGKSFDGSIVFWTRDGKRRGIVMNSMSIFGIPIIRNPRKNAELFPPLFDAVDKIIARSMAQRYIYAIQQGQTVEVAGLLINGAAAVPKGKSPQKTEMITKVNYQACEIIGGGTGVRVYGKMGELIWGSSIWSTKNVLLLPHILDAIFR